MGQFVAAVLGSTETVWTDIFAQAGRTYKPPTLVMFSGATQSGCGFAKSAMGPFYCPLDQKVYLDTSFFQDLEGRLGACQVGSKTCQFSQAYVIGHEIVTTCRTCSVCCQKRSRRSVPWIRPRPTVCRSALSCKPIALLASGLTEAKQSGDFIEPGDVDFALQTASAIGDDRLQRQSQGYVVPDAFTHGTSAQRSRWFTTGLKSGDVASCDTFRNEQL